MTNFEIKFFETEEDRNEGVSSIAFERFNNLNEAKDYARKLYYKDGNAAVEIIKRDDNSCSNTVIFGLYNTYMSQINGRCSDYIRKQAKKEGFYINKDRDGYYLSQLTPKEMLMEYGSPKDLYKDVEKRVTQVRKLVTQEEYDIFEEVNYEVSKHNEYIISLNDFEDELITQEEEAIIFKFVLETAYKLEDTKLDDYVKNVITAYLDNRISKEDMLNEPNKTYWKI